MRRTLWVLAALFVTLQTGFFLTILFWPGAGDLPAAILRLRLWQGLQVAPGQLFFCAPLLLWLGWGAPNWQVRLLIGSSFALLAALVFTTAIDVHLVTTLRQQAGGVAPPTLQFLTLLRLAEFALALVGALILRLAWRAEYLRTAPLAPAGQG